MNWISLFERCTINDNFSMELDKPSLNSPNPDVYILGLGEQFEVKTIMGQGGSARVFRWIDSNNNQWALKVIKNEKKFNDEKVNKMISKEYYISTLLANHPNILKWHAVEYMGKIVAKTKSVQIAKFNVLEIAQNGSLHRFIRSTGGVEENLARFMFYQLASAVEFMHSQLIAHFDIKLDNILLDEFYNIKLADFGTAEILESSESRLNAKREHIVIWHLKCVTD